MFNERFLQWIFMECADATLALKMQGVGSWLILKCDELAGIFYFGYQNHSRFFLIFMGINFIDENKLNRWAWT